MRKRNTKSANRFLALLLTLVIVISMIPAAVFAENASTVETDLKDKTAVVGEYLEFTVKTMANDNVGAAVFGHLEFNEGDWSVIESLQYMETQEPYNGQWFELPAGVPFGPPETGFPLTDNAVSTFRVKFKTAGQYPFAISMKSVDGQVEYCSTQETVTAREPESSQVTTDLADQVAVVGEYLQFTVKTMANDNAGAAVFGHLTFNDGDWSAIESLQYMETQEPYNGQWFELPANVPFGPPETGFPLTDNAVSTFRVKFKTAGQYPFAISMKSVDGQVEYCSTQETVNVRDAVASEITVTLPDKIVIGQEVEFGVTTKANDDLNKMVLGYLDFNGGDWSGIEWLKYQETQEPYNGQWFDLPANVPFGPTGGFPMKDAESKFCVKFKDAGTYTFKIAMKTVGENAEELCFIEKTITVTDDVSVSVNVNDAAMGTATATPDVVKVGETTKVAVKAAEGYAIAEIKVDDQVYTEDFTQYCTAFDFELAPVLDTVVDVTFVRLYKIQISVDKNGKVTVDDNQPEEGSVLIAEPNVKENGEFTVIATPTTVGYSVVTFDVADYTGVLPELSQKAGEEYKVDLPANDYVIKVVFADVTPADITIKEDPKTEWDNEKSFSFTVTDSAQGDCKVYVSDNAELSVENATKLEPAADGIYTYTVKEAIAEEKTFYIHAEDAAGNASQKEVKVVQIDTEPPVVVEVIEATRWGTTKYTVTASDAGGSEVANVWFTNDSEGKNNLEKTNLINGTYVFRGDANKEYYIVVKDNAGNLFVQHADEPTIVLGEITVPDDWTADEAAVSIALDIAPANVNLYWSYNGEYEDADVVMKAKDVIAITDAAFDALANGTYYIYAIDTNTKHMDVDSIEITLIDNTDPVVNPISKMPKVEWHNDEVTVSGSVSDIQDSGDIHGSGVVSVVYNTTGIFEDSKESADYNEENGTYSFPVDVENDKILNETYYVWAIDSVGKESEAKSVKIQIDKVNPIGEVSVNDHETTWKALLEKLTFGIFRNEDVEVTLTYSDVDETNSGIKNVKYYIDDVDASELDENGEVNRLTATELNAAAFEDYTKPVVVEDDRQYAVYFRIEDNASNVIFLNSDGIIRDTVAPVGTISVQQENAEKVWASWTGSGEVAEGNDDNKTFEGRDFAKLHSNVALTVVVSAEDTGDIQSGIKSVQYCKSHNIRTYDEIVNETAWDDYTEALTFNDNERFVVYVRIEDKAGNVTFLSSDGIVVDNKEPSGAETEEKEIIITPEKDNLVEDSGIYKGDVTVSVTVYDPKYDHAEGKADGDFSGLKEISYQVIAEDLPAQETGVEGAPEYLVRKGLLYKAEWTEGDTWGDLLFKPADVEDADAYFESNATKESVDNTELVSKWEGQIVIPSAVFNSNNTQIIITAIDNAGNPRTSEPVNVKIDVTIPEITIDYDNDAADSNKYFKADRTATITVTERNFSAEDFKFVFMQDGKPVNVAGKDLTWKPTKGTGNGDDITHTATYLFNQDADYLMGTTEEVKENVPYVLFVDMADNSYYTAENGGVNYVGTAATDFTIDQTAPVVSVAYNNNSAENDKYFKALRTATVTVVEHNFPVNDMERVIFTRTANRGGILPTISWSHNGDTHIATIAYSADGDYTFDVTMSDLAGNESAAANYGSSVAGKDFIIDTTYEDMISQSGVENGVAYGHDAEVIPSIEISDINLQEYTVTLTGVQKDNTIDLTDDVNALLSKGVETVTGIFDIFETTQDLDGIYTLKMTSKDKAGNKDSMEIVFTVNRFGSVYVFEDYLLNLVKDGGAYVQMVDDDLVLTEYNADKLLADSLKIEITVDGKPLENVQYTVTPEINDKVEVGNSGWYQYKYVISKDNFKNDGIYKISVASEDATGNTPENTNYEDKGMTFRVDSMKTEITSVIGLEEAIVNAQEITVKYTVFDAIGIKHIAVYVGGVIVDEIADFSADPNNYTGSFKLSEKNTAQAVRIVVEDLAGNITDTNAEDFAPAYEFHGAVTVSTNIFVRWYANKGLFWGSIGGTVVVIAAVLALIAKKKKKVQ